MNPTPLTYLDGETLMSTVLPPIRFVVNRFIPWSALQDDSHHQKECPAQ